MAGLTGKVLKGSMPSEMPAQEPTTFERVINQRAAGGIDVEIPLSVFARVDEAVE